jgi:hypothetical protein
LRFPLGDIAYRSSTANVKTRLGLGTAGQVLTVNSGATAPEWATPGASVPANASATVATYQSTTSTSYTDLATSGPAVTLTTGTKALVIITGLLEDFDSGIEKWMSFAVSGATTIAASDTRAIVHNASTNNGRELRASATSVVTLTAGSNTFTAKYRTGAATAYYGDRDIFVMNLA